MGLPLCSHGMFLAPCCGFAPCSSGASHLVLSPLSAGRGSTGAARSGLGYSGMPYSLAIEFDTYSDSFEQDLVPPYVNGER